MMAHPYTVRVEESTLAAEQVMNAHRIRHLAVVNNKKVVGLISDRDVAIAKNVYHEKASRGEVNVRDVCLLDPYLVQENEPINVVARTMAKKKIEAAVVVREGVPVGIFTVTDACRFLADLLDSKHETEGLWTKLFGK